MGTLKNRSSTFFEHLYCLVSRLENHSVNIQVIMTTNHMKYVQKYSFPAKTGARPKTTPLPGNLLWNIEFVLEVIFGSSMDKYLELNLVLLKKFYVSPSS